MRNDTDERDERKAAAALIGGAVAFIVTMAFHPTGRDFHGPGGPGHATVVGYLVHGLALVSLAVTGFGCLTLARRLGSGGLVAWGAGAAAGGIAAVLNGFVAPGLIADALDPGSTARDSARLLLDYNWRLNQAFAGVLVVASWGAVMLWSLEILRARRLGLGIGVYGLGAGLLALVGFLAGHVRLDVHGFGMLVVLQSLWFVAAGVSLWRGAASGAR